MANVRLCGGIVALLLAPMVAVPHHNTGALFDLDAEIALEGVIVEYAWANPHVYVYVDVAGVRISRSIFARCPPVCSFP